MSTIVVIILLILLLVGTSFLFNSWFASMFIFFARTLSPEKEVKLPTWKEITPLALLLMTEGLFRKIIKFDNPLLQTISETIILVVTSYFFVKLMRKMNIIPSQKVNENAPTKNRRKTITMIVGLVVFFAISYLINTH